MHDDATCAAQSGNGSHILQKAASEFVAQRIEGIAHEVRAIGSPAGATFADIEALSFLSSILQRTLKKIDDIFELNGFVFSPACLIVLELFQARGRGSVLTVAAACKAANCPESVGRRWIDVLEDMHLLEKTGDPRTELRVALTERGYLKATEALKLLL